MPCTIESWLVQREIWRAKDKSADLKELGFATFFLNRTNRSGILAGGVIGGKNQNGAMENRCSIQQGRPSLRLKRLDDFLLEFTSQILR